MHKTPNDFYDSEMEKRRHLIEVEMMWITTEYFQGKMKESRMKDVSYRKKIYKLYEDFLFERFNIQDAIRLLGRTHSIVQKLTHFSGDSILFLSDSLVNQTEEYYQLVSPKVAVSVPLSPETEKESTRRFSRCSFGARASETEDFDRRVPPRAVPVPPKVAVPVPLSLETGFSAVPAKGISVMVSKVSSDQVHSPIPILSPQLTPEKIDLLPMEDVSILKTPLEDFGDIVEPEVSVSSSSCRSTVVSCSKLPLKSCGKVFSCRSTVVSCSKLPLKSCGKVFPKYLEENFAFDPLWDLFASKEIALFLLVLLQSGFLISIWDPGIFDVSCGSSSILLPSNLRRVGTILEVL